VFDAQLFGERLVDTNTDGRLVSSTLSGTSHQRFPLHGIFAQRMARHPTMQRLELPHCSSLTG
jgi:hypothetical protein